MPEKLFRDPLYDYIAIDTGICPWLLDLINCPEVQRLRYINQLGLSHFTYPGSTHSRFSHSLGVYYLMAQSLEQLERTHGSSVFGPGEKDALRAAALLHDIGHGPFSHATESFFGHHEQRGVSIIMNSASAVNRVLSEVDTELPAKVASLVAKKPLKGLPQPHLWQKSLISSPLDMDRLDYLRRDSLFSGAEYGRFDWFRIIHTMHLKEKVSEAKQEDTFVVWPDKSKFALEEYVFSRFYMYQSVYFHHTTRGFEGLLQRILERARDLSQQDQNFAKTLLAAIEPFIRPAVSEDLADYGRLTDSLLLAQVAIWQNSTDQVLKDLTDRLLARKGLSWQEIEQKMGFEYEAEITAVRDYLTKQGCDHKYYFFQDTTQAIAYKPYRPASEVEDQSSVNSIMLYDPSWEKTGFREISDVPGLQRLKAITEDRSPPIMRYYFPKEHDTHIKQLLT